MNRNYVVYGLLGLGLLLGGYGLYSQFYPSLLDQFNREPAQLQKDLEGQMVGLPYGQGWPFDPTQKVQLTTISKKQVDQFVVLFANVQAKADVTPIKSKDEQKEVPKLPKKVALSGVLKMTYEKIGDQWYLVHLDGVGMKAVPIN